MRTLVMCVCLAVLPVAPVVARLAPAAQDLPAGRLTAVVSRADRAHRYHVYLPSRYTPEIRRPVLFIMDDRGRGRVAAEVFRAAAERHGWILLSSNHASGSQSASPSFDALRAMWTDAHDLWAIDTRRLYIAGVAGTARVATAIASQLEGQVAGVIGASGGLAPEQPAASLSPFLFFGTAGDEDHNYWEMRALEHATAADERAARVEYFGGAGGWMPAPLASAAVEWLELKAMQRGLTPVSDAVVDAVWARDQRAVAAFEDLDRPAAAARRLAAMARDFSGIVPAGDLDDVRHQAAALADDDRRRAEEDADRRGRERHAERTAAAMRTLGRAFLHGAAQPSMTVPETIDALGVKDLQAAAARVRGDAALEARRLLAELSAQTGLYLPLDAIERGHDSRARYYLYLAELINAAEPYQWLIRARVAMRAGAAPEAMACLRAAIDRGFRTLDPLEHDPLFEPLRSRKDFQELVERLREPPRPDARRR